ncbi:MAG: hypothetical protein H8E12_11125 [Rhodobacteraceae bacterium]|nr:hypothetical protein [Paracoccaceae bacterium]
MKISKIIFGVIFIIIGFKGTLATIASILINELSIDWFATVFAEHLLSVLLFAAGIISVIKGLKQNSK